MVGFIPFNVNFMKHVNYSFSTNEHIATNIGVSISECNQMTLVASL